MIALKQEEKGSISRLARKKCILHFIKAFLLPALISTLPVLLCCGRYGKQLVDIVSPQAALSNISGFITMILGFLFTFLSIILGLSGTKNIQSIFHFPATRFQFWCTLLAPMIYGLIALVFTTYMSAMLPDAKLSCTMSEMLLYCSSVLTFLLSFLNSSIIYIRVINIAARP